MARKLISSGTKFEELASYSRAVVDSGWVFVAGTTGVNYETGDMPEDVGEQTEQVLRNIEQALAEAGASLNDIVRITCFISERAYLMPVAAILGRVFKDIRPANTTVCAPLVTEEMKVEIEVQARLPESS